MMFIGTAEGETPLSPKAQHHAEGTSVVITGTKGERVRLTSYGHHVMRVQAVRPGEEFFPDDRYEMIVAHPSSDSLLLSEKQGFLRIALRTDSGIVVSVDMASLKLSFFRNVTERPFLEEDVGTRWRHDTIVTSFVCHQDEHFTGLGHGYYGRAESLDLRGEVIHRNYGSQHGEQAPLLVPFYLSDRGYGVVLNSTFPNTFVLGKDGRYEMSLLGDGRMDYVVILGPGFPDIIDRYTQLTGRPRFPPRAAFGLALSDKGNDHTSSDPSDEAWWKRKVTEQGNAGFPIDHIVNDNRWRAGGGKRCESYFAWDTTRYPDPQEYQRWIREHGLFVTLDFNRCIAAKSDGWKPSFNIPFSDSIEFRDSAPDFTRKEVRAWFWNLFWRKSLDPALGYPGDALWIDEFDEMGKAPPSMLLGNGRSWNEMKNSWFFLIAKALVQEGWDNLFRGTKRPFVWVRGMSAGAQRWATLWSGDIKPTYTEMKTQVRGMLLAGLSGFPFWGHDAGGFRDWESGTGPDDTMYRNWSMAFGAFSPFWKPHGMGQSRWPLDRSSEAQADAHRYGRLRYELMPYIYTYAHEASQTGMPIARAMIIEHQNDSLAWKCDLQYQWGHEFLVAPNCSDGDSVTLWLPNGDWYDFWSDTRITGGRILTLPSPTGMLPLFVRSGAIIPMAPAALSTAFIPEDSLILHVYTGNDATFVLYEDDGISESYRTEGAFRTTRITFTQSTLSLDVAPPTGTYASAPEQRAYQVVFHGLPGSACFAVDRVRVPRETTTGESALNGAVVRVPRRAIHAPLHVRAISPCP